MLTRPLRALVGGIPSSSRRRRLRITILEVQVRRLLRVARSAGVDQDIVSALNALAARRHEIERAVVVWIDLIEVLVQTEERRYGPRAGLGPLKAAEVREALRYLLTRRRFELPGIPDYLQPLVIDTVVGWCVDAIVRVANRYGLWAEDVAAQRTFRMMLAQAWLMLRKLLRPIGVLVVRIYTAIRDGLHQRGILSPQVLAAVRAVEREGLITTQGDLITGAVNLLRWIANHRDQLVAGFEIVFAAVQEVEGYFALSGAEKRAYARDLVLAALDELGFKQRAGLLFGLIDSLIGGGIESAVHLFHKRGVFEHRHV